MRGYTHAKLIYVPPQALYLTPASQTENPRPEDVECLSKLMVTVGNLLDHSVKIQRIQTEGGGERKAPSKELMDVSPLLEWGAVYVFLCRACTLQYSISSPRHCADVFPADRIIGPECCSGLAAQVHVAGHGRASSE